MKEPINTLYEELREDLVEYEEMGIIPIKKLTGALRTAREVIARLKTHILKKPFDTQQEEIDFFKKEKPLFVAEQLYAVDLCMIQVSKPVYDKTLIRAFLETELRQIAAFLEKYGSLYQYYQLDAVDMDALFFVRAAQPRGVLIPETGDLDPEFSTACDHAWARFMAYERLREWLLGELNTLDGGGFVARGKEDVLPVAPAGALKWTGETINLVELAYGIWLTGQVNNGNVSVTEIVEFLERMFRVRIGKPHRRWQSIVGRKRVGYTKFLDEMKGLMEKRIEEEMGR